MSIREMKAIKEAIEHETNGWNLVEISKLCQDKLKKMNDGLKVLFE